MLDEEIPGFLIDFHLLRAAASLAWKVKWKEQ